MVGSESKRAGRGYPDRDELVHLQLELLHMVQGVVDTCLQSEVCMFDSFRKIQSR